MAAQRTTRQIRADDTRRRLFAAAAELFAAHGYHDTTVDQIAKLAGVAKGTFFVHFATKDAVVAELVRHQVRAARRARALALAEGGTPIQALVAAVTKLGEEAGASRPLSRAVMAALLENPELSGYADAVFGELLADMRQDIRAARRARLLQPTANVDSVADTLIATYLGAALYFTSSPRAKPLLELLRPLLEANLAGFRGARAKPRKRRRSRMV